MENKLDEAINSLHELFDSIHREQIETRHDIEKNNDTTKFVGALIVIIVINTISIAVWLLLHRS